MDEKEQAKLEEKALNLLNEFLYKSLSALASSDVLAGPKAVGRVEQVQASSTLEVF